MRLQRTCFEYSHTLANSGRRTSVVKIACFKAWCASNLSSVFLSFNEWLHAQDFHLDSFGSEPIALIAPACKKWSLVPVLPRVIRITNPVHHFVCLQGKWWSLKELHLHSRMDAVPINWKKAPEMVATLGVTPSTFD